MPITVGSCPRCEGRVYPTGEAYEVGMCGRCEVGPVPSWRQMALRESIGVMVIEYYYGLTVEANSYKAVAKLVRFPMAWLPAERNLEIIRGVFMRATGLRLWRFRPAINEYLGGKSL